MTETASRPAAERLGRRGFLKGAVGAGVCAAAPALGFLSGEASAANWRGLVGCIKPRANDPSAVDMIRLLPQGIGVVTVYLNFTQGTEAEFQNSFANYEKNIAYLVSLHCDVISIEGAPPFMLLGPEGEAKLVDGWKEKYKTDMFTSSRNQIEALNAMKIKTIFGASEFSGDINKSYAKYFEASGIAVTAMEGMDNVAFGSIPDVPPEALYKFIKARFLAQKGADAVYILGSAWDTLGIIEELEQDLSVPVIQPVAARIWEIERRLHVHQPIKGYGRLLETLPA